MSTVLIGGGSGLIGTRLSQLLADQQFTVLHLSRRARPQALYPTYQWDVARGTIDQEAVDRADYIINLAGAGIADGRWTPARKRLIIESRTESTRLLKRAIQRRSVPPRAYLSASAIGYYGNRGDEWMDESAGPNTGFLSTSTQAWEAAVEEVAALGLRTVVLRTGITLSTQGGALAKMLPPVYFYLSAYFGDGRQFYSWIHIDDVCRMYLHAIAREDLSGTYNAVAPEPVRNRTFAQILGPAIGKRALVLPAPAFALRIVFGEMAHTILDSARCSAEKIQAAGFSFQYPDLQPAITDLVRRRI